MLYTFLLSGPSTQLQCGGVSALLAGVGVVVVYGAEQFVDDGSPLFAIMKGIKRAMATEYSRDLSVKVHSAQVKFSMMGYKQGGRLG